MKFPVNSAEIDLARLTALYNQARSLIDDKLVMGFSYKKSRLVDNKNPEENLKTQVKLKQDIESIFMNFSLLKRFVDVVSEYKKVPTDEPNVMKVHRMILILEYFGMADEEKRTISFIDFDGFDKLKNVGLFFAALLDSSEATNGADAVKGVLQEFVDDKAAFKAKRLAPAYYSTITKSKFTITGDVSHNNYSVSCRIQYVFPCDNSLFVSSYYGYAMSSINVDGESDWKGRAFGPVGFELKLVTIKGSPISLNYAPLDLGNYITAELKGDSYDAQIEDILAPSLFLSWSAAKKPFSLLAGYQKDIKIDNGLKDDAWFISVAFDLPIAVIY